ncbi:MAG: hypothetical protein AAF629_13290, partial [Chloroflexota bacterium]
ARERASSTAKIAATEAAFAAAQARLDAHRAQRDAQSPLMLNIMSLAYQGTSADDLAHPSLNTDEMRRKHLFDTYIARMFTRKGDRGEFQVYDATQTKQRLSWLAQNMQHHNQAVFLIENLQPSWLDKRPRWWMYTLISRMVFGVIVGVISMPVLQVAFGLLGGLSIGLVDIIRFEKLGEPKKLSMFWQTVINVIGVGLFVGLFVGLLVGPIDGLLYGLILGPSVGLIGGLRGGQQYLVNDIRTIEILHLSWLKAIKKGLIFGLITGLSAWLIFGSIFGLIIWWSEDVRVVLSQNMSVEQVEGLSAGVSEQLSQELNFGLTLGLFYGLILGLIFGPGIGLLVTIFNGLDPQIIESKNRPNQGIHLSRKNAIRGGIIVGIIVGVIVGIIVGLSNGLVAGLYFALSEQNEFNEFFEQSGFNETIHEVILKPNDGLGEGEIGRLIDWMGSGLNKSQISGLTIGLYSGLTTGLSIALTVGVYGALWYGGLDVIRHYTLRLLLILQGHTPRNYAHFLDHATDLIFLQKVGGGYRFIHRLVLEHFADMDESHQVGINDKP